MIVYLVLTVVTVVLSLFVKKDNNTLSYGYSRQQVMNGLCLLSIFILLFAVSALRLNVGNDYATYCEYFHLIRCKLTTETIVPTEPGFNLVCLIIYFISGCTENYLLMFAVFGGVTIFLFVKAMSQQSDWFFLSFFLFISFGYYFQSFSTIRYYLVLAMAVAAIPFVLSKQWFKFILVILLGAFFHKSLLLVLPLYFLTQINWKKYQLAIIAVLCASLVYFKPWLMKLFLILYPTYEGTEYLETGSISWINVIRCAGVLVLALLLYKKAVKDDRRMKFYFYCNLEALAVYLCLSFLPFVSRIGHYLSITQILFIPALIKRIENKKLRRLLLVGVLIAGTAYLLIYLIKKAPTDGVRVLPYQTFLFHDMVNILSDVS